MAHDTPAGAGELRRAKRRRLGLLSLLIAAAGLAALLFGGSRPHDSTLGITLVFAGVLALSASIITAAIALTKD